MLESHRFLLEDLEQLGAELRLLGCQLPQETCAGEDRGERRGEPVPGESPVVDECARVLPLSESDGVLSQLQAADYPLEREQEQRENGDDERVDEASERVRDRSEGGDRDPVDAAENEECGQGDEPWEAASEPPQVGEYDAAEQKLKTPMPRSKTWLPMGGSSVTLAVAC